MSQRKAVQCPAHAQPPELHFSEAKSAGGQSTGSSSPNVKQNVSLKTAGGLPAGGNPSPHVPAKGSEVCPLSQMCQTQGHAGNEALLTSF